MDHEEEEGTHLVVLLVLELVVDEDLDLRCDEEVEEGELEESPEFEVVLGLQLVLEELLLLVGLRRDLVQPTHQLASPYVFSDFSSLDFCTCLFSFFSYSSWLFSSISCRSSGFISELEFPNILYIEYISIKGLGDIPSYR